MKAALAVWLLLTLTTLHSYALQKDMIDGRPKVRYYGRRDFKGDAQFWTATEDSLGIMYFGNNDGTLIFDGTSWESLALPNNSSTRSLHYASDGHVYAGGFGQFGRITQDAYGNWHFESLTELLPTSDRNFDNVWSIHEHQGYILFRTYSKLFALKNGKITIIPNEYIYFSTSLFGNYYLADKSGLKTLDLEGFDFDLLFTSEQIGKSEIGSILSGSTNGELLVITKEGMAFRYMDGKLSPPTNLISDHSQYQIIDGLKSQSGTYLFGTLHDQILAYDEDLKVVRSGKSYWGLQDNTVLNLFETRNGNVWALLNNGLDLLTFASPSTILYEDAAVFDVAVINKNRLYIATNQGVLTANLENGKNLNYTEIPILEGQAWTLNVLDGKLVCGHDRGLFSITGGQAARIGDITSVWKAIKVEGEHNKYLVCTYDGLMLMEYDDEKGFQLKNRIEGFNESSRDILQAEEAGVFWVCHGYKGVYRLKIDKNLQRVIALEHYRENGLPSPYNINVTRWDDDIVFTTNNGIFHFDRIKNQFLPYERLNDALGTALNVRKILESSDKTWFVRDDMLGYFTPDDPDNLHLDLFLELKGTFNRGLECLYPYPGKSILIGTTEGLFAYASDHFQDAHKKTQITNVHFRSEDEIVNARLDALSLELPYGVRDISISYASPQMSDPEAVQFRSRLGNLSDAWSDWSESGTKEYEQLSPGKYVFDVQSRSLLGEKGTTASYTFQILPVWYKTTTAYWAYLLIITATLATSRKMVKRKIRKEKAITQQEEEKKRGILELELERIKLEHEKERIEMEKRELEEDVVDKSKELTNYTMLLAKKRELITEIKAELQALKEAAKNETNRTTVRNIIRKITMHLNDEEYLKVFEINFERVHKEFFDELKKHFPDLSPKELRLCALVRMNLTNKDIAPILNISIRGVETARYRLRKRLSIDHEENMVAFLDKLSGESNEA